MIVVSNFSLLMRGLSLPYRIKRYNLRHISTQMCFKATLGAQNQFKYCCRKGVIHDYTACINTIKGPDHPKTNNITCNQCHTSLEGNMFFKDKGKNEEARKKRIWKMHMLLGLSLFSSKEEGKEEKESELIIMIKRGILALKVIILCLLAHSAMADGNKEQRNFDIICIMNISYRMVS